MKTLIAALFALVLAANARGGYLIGSVDLYPHADGLTFFSNGYAYWYPCGDTNFYCTYLTVSGRHMISFDGVGPAGLIAYNWISQQMPYSESIESVAGSCSSAYRARVSVTADSSSTPKPSQAWGSQSVRTNECDGPSSANEPGENQSPVLLAFEGDLESALSGPRHPVSFDIMADGYPRDICWTRRAAKVGFLVLDRDRNGRIDSGAELFGNHTPSADGRPPRPDSNGYAALAQYDFQEFGGNEDGRISRADAIWGDLRVWIDANHDGVSQPDELVPLERLGVVEIGLDYSIRSEKDRYGNLFRFESYAVTRDPSGAERRIPTWDVFLVSADR